MQAPEGGASGPAGHQDGRGRQHIPPAPDCQGSSGSITDAAGRSHLSGSSGPDDQGASSLSGQGSPVREGVADEVAVGEEAVATSHGNQAPRAPGPSGDATARAVGPGSRLLEFSLTVPFRSPLEAEMARRSLVPDAQRQEIVQKEFIVNGSVLAVRWTADDPVLFRISVNAFLDHLSLVMRNIRRIGPPVLLKQGQKRRRET